MKLLSIQRFLAIYSGALTVILAVTILCGFSSMVRNPEFGIINARRINIVEPDGTVRLTLQPSRLSRCVEPQEGSFPDYFCYRVGSRLKSTAKRLSRETRP